MTPSPSASRGGGAAQPSSLVASPDRGCSTPSCPSSPTRAPAPRSRSGGRAGSVAGGAARSTPAPPRRSTAGGRGAPPGAGAGAASSSRGAACWRCRTGGSSRSRSPGRRAILERVPVAGQPEGDAARLAVDLRPLDDVAGCPQLLHPHPTARARLPHRSARRRQGRGRGEQGPHHPGGGIRHVGSGVGLVDRLEIGEQRGHRPAIRASSSSPQSTSAITIASQHRRQYRPP